MSIDSWMVLWKVVLIAGIAMFAVLAVFVTIGGFFDVRRLFHTLHQQYAEQQGGGKIDPDEVKAP